MRSDMLLPHVRTKTCRILFALSVSTLTLAAQTAGERGTSAHRKGPHGLEGWTISSAVPDHGSERYPVTLMISRHGHILRKVDGSAFVWNWMFQADGKHVAYESGPFHFGLTCVLVETETGRRLADYNCFGELPADAPPWVKVLERWSANAH